MGTVPDPAKKLKSSLGLKAVYALKTVFPVFTSPPSFLNLFALELSCPRSHRPVKESTHVSTSSSPTTKPDGDQPSSMAIKPNISVLLIILPYSILLWFLRRILDNEGPESSVGHGVQSVLMPEDVSEGFWVSSGCHRTMSPVAFCFLFVPHLYVSLTDTHSLSCNFIVKARTAPGQPWYEGQCSVDRVPFLQYDNDNKATPLGDLGKEVDATNAWTDLIQSLKDIFEELRKQLLNMEPVTEKTRGHHTLQVTTVSRYKQEQLIDAFWNFTIGEQYSCLFYPMNKTWRVIHDKDRGTMKQWETNRELAQGLRKFSMGDSRHCLTEFLKHWQEIPRPTSRAPDVIQLTPATGHSHFIAITEFQRTTKFQCEEVYTPVAAVIAIILPFIVGIFVKKFCTQGGTL
ncbi:hypothetical protein A6R68_00971 [Neotoma lepida]|uniref:Retinoic acid early-inducible protein 1 domain-containing protein n=1 Tax=Neotoma lepida TaxID=56216 RepID=A0A1A6GYR6_NEOLE|nr:hypothetical protein A6R68_00971 [Neotoma lepida]